MCRATQYAYSLLTHCVFLAWGLSVNRLFFVRVYRFYVCIVSIRVNVETSVRTREVRKVGAMLLAIFSFGRLWHRIKHVCSYPWRSGRAGWSFDDLSVGCFFCLSPDAG